MLRWHRPRDDRRLHALLQRRRRLFVLPLQLEGDAQIREHSPFMSMRELILEVFGSFARAAPATLCWWSSIIRSIRGWRVMAARQGVWREGWALPTAWFTWKPGSCRVCCAKGDAAPARPSRRPPE